MKKLVRGAMIASGLSLFAIRTASAQPADVKIYDVGHSGTGCPAGSVDWNISQNSSSVFLGFDAFVAETSASVTSARKNCQIVMDLRFDPAWSFTVFRVDYRGFADLDAGVLAQQKSTYFFQGVPPAGDASASTTLYGSFFNNYSRSDEVGLLVWSPCDGSNSPLVINTEVRVKGQTNLRGSMTLDSVSGKVVQVYDLKWRKCH